MSGDAYARNDNPETSHEAAYSVDATALEAKVVYVMTDVGKDGVTSEQASDTLGMEKGTVSPRFRPLANKGIIVDSGRRRKNRTGRNAIVWVLKEFADDDGPTFAELHDRICEEEYENTSDRY